jgi:hypothetical protein
MGLLGMVLLLILPAVVVAVGEWGVVVGMRMPGGSVLIVVAEATGVVVADMPMVVAMLGREVGVLGFFALAFGSLPDVAHGRASLRINGFSNSPAWHVPRAGRCCGSANGSGTGTTVLSISFSSWKQAI